MKSPRTRAASQKDQWGFGTHESFDLKQHVLQRSRCEEEWAKFVTSGSLGAPPAARRRRAPPQTPAP